MTSKTALKIGCIDGLVFFLVLACIRLATSTHIFADMAMIVMFLLPISIFVGWRGSVLTNRILSGNDRFKRTAIEGFIWGAGIALLISFVLSRFISFIQPSFITLLLPASVIIGIANSLISIALHTMNRRIIGVKEPINPEQPPSGSQNI